MVARTRTAQPSSEVAQSARKAVKKTPSSAHGPADAQVKPVKTAATPAPARKTKKAGTKSALNDASVTKQATNTAPRSRLSEADRKEFTELIVAELDLVRAEYDSSMAVLDALKNAGQDSSGDDPADAGAKTFEREQEMSLANNRLHLIAQMERALRRIEEGTYGVCESCNKLIPKGRLQAFPQATLCVECKSREERR